MKLTVRPRFFRRPSRLRRLEFARRRATCTGIIGCAASGAPLDAGRHLAARNLTSRRWDDTESHVASSSPARIVLSSLNGTLRSLFESRVHLRVIGDSEESLLISWRGPIHKAPLRVTSTRQHELIHGGTGRCPSLLSRAVGEHHRLKPRRLAKFLARGTSINIALGSWDRSRRRRLRFIALLVHSPDHGVIYRANRFRLL